ncbi:isatin hydrolase [Trichonephila inaurata madagascariensis]|uniref:Isatin hydrolase n=2 Tax=Trichonephila inaurata madagascariensis TaxID=2747483 RepID=A0A8X6XUE0_9ARAC|nr:isatin hydrolase [Trichonephila inaurata madagascariensis]
MVDLTYVYDERSHRYPIFRKFNFTVTVNGTTDAGIWIRSEEYTSSTHTGTHMDAPSHFIKDGINIDQIPITQFVAPAAVIDITEKASQNPDSEATIDDLTHWESITGHSLNGKILLFKSGWGSKYYNSTAYLGTSDDGVTNMVYPGISPEAAQWLVDNRNIKGVGVDTLSFDKGTSQDFGSHQILLGHGVFGLENVANMEEVPIHGAMLYVLPMKIAGASGAPTRVIATFPEVIF